MTRRVGTFVPVGLALLLYAASLNFGRTFDDIHQIPVPGEPMFRTLADAWTSPYWVEPRGGGLYRPVTSTSFWLEGRLDLPLPVRHAVNVGLHAAITGLAVLLALELGLGAAAAGWVGVLFALHPAHVEVVAGLVGRAELLAALFMLLALLGHERLLRSSPGSRRRRALGLASLGCLAFLAASSKESAWLLPLFAVFWIAVRNRGGLRSPGPWIAYGAGIAGHLLLRQVVLGGWLNAPDVVLDPGDNPLVRLDGPERMIGGLRVLGLFLGHLILPWTLSPDYSGSVVDVGGGAADPRLWGGVLFLAGSAGLAGWGLGHGKTAPGRTWGVAGGWLLVSALTSLNLVFDLGTILAERLLFWPTLAWSLALGGAAASIARVRASKPEGILGPRVRPEAAIGIGLAVALGLAYLTLTVRYLPAWRNDATLFAAAVRATPGSPRVWFNHGRALQEEGHQVAALEAYARAKSLDPGDYQVWAQEGALRLEMGQAGPAESALAEALRLEPGDPISKVNEGVLWMERGETERAILRFREVLEQHPERTEALMNLALAEGRLGRATEAEAHWQAYLARKPNDAAALNNLAWLLATSLGRPRDAEPLARDAVALRPMEPNLRDTLAEALWRQGRAREAEAVAREALALGPDPDLARSLGRFLPATDSTAARSR